MELIVHTVAELKPAAEKLLEYAGDRNIWVFRGEIGAGKTTFIKAICRQLSVEDAVTSPTFSLVNEYWGKTPKSGEGIQIYHLDLYRLKDIEEALNIGIEEYLYQANLCLIEWPEIIEPLLPQEVVRINMEIVDNSTRKILFL